MKAGGIKLGELAAEWFWRARRGEEFGEENLCVIQATNCEWRYRKSEISEPGFLCKACAMSQTLCACMYTGNVHAVCVGDTIRSSS